MANEFVRLNVNLNQPTADALSTLMAELDVTATEATRRAISVLKYLHDAQEHGAVIILRGAHTEREIQLL